MSKEKYNGETSLALLIQKIRAALNARVSKSTTINGKPLSSNITLTAEDIGGTSVETMTGNELQAIWDENIAGTEGSQTLTDIVTAHINNKNNPHNTTAADVGAIVGDATTLWSGSVDSGTITLAQNYTNYSFVSIEVLETQTNNTGVSTIPTQIIDSTKKYSAVGRGVNGCYASVYFTNQNTVTIADKNNGKLVGIYGIK